MIDEQQVVWADEVEVAQALAGIAPSAPGRDTASAIAAGCPLIELDDDTHDLLACGGRPAAAGE